MSEKINVAQFNTSEDLKSHIAELAMKDPGLRQELLSNPKAALSRVLGVQIPDFINVHVVEETATSFYLVLPPAVSETDELSDQELAAAAGGAKCSWASSKWSLDYTASCKAN